MPLFQSLTVFYACNTTLRFFYEKKDEFSFIVYRYLGGDCCNIFWLSFLCPTGSGLFVDRGMTNLFLKCIFRFEEADSSTIEVPLIKLSLPV